MNSYKSTEWGMSFEYPTNWDILFENENDGPWEIVVAVGGNQTRSGMAGVTVSAMHHELLDPNPKVKALDAEIPAISEFIEGSKKKLVQLFPGFKFVSSDLIAFAGIPTAIITYTYKGESSSIQSRQFTLFGNGTTYRIECESPASDFRTTEPNFKLITDSLEVKQVV